MSEHVHVRTLILVVLGVFGLLLLIIIMAAIEAILWAMGYEKARFFIRQGFKIGAAYVGFIVLALCCTGIWNYFSPRPVPSPFHFEESMEEARERHKKGILTPEEIAVTGDILSDADIRMLCQNESDYKKVMAILKKRGLR